MVENNNYESKAVIRSIKATSRVSTKVNDDFYTLEYTEERLLPEDLNEEEIAMERKILWDVVNGECDGQINDIYEMFKSHAQSVKNKMHTY